ncbi:MAG: hypothetical protein H6772_01240 [Pseudomonadales bacterium]|nr:hypothetical protein [Pseudomonadales bacterium]
MNLLKNLLSRPKSDLTMTKSQTFAQKKVSDINLKYKKALEERKKLVRAQYAADSTLGNLYQTKRSMVDRKISRLEFERENSRKK